MVAGCAGSIQPQTGSTNARAATAGEGHIITMATLSKKLQRTDFCVEGVYEYSSDVDTPVRMSVTDETGNVTWLYDSKTGKESKCAVEPIGPRAIPKQRLNSPPSSTEAPVDSAQSEPRVAEFKDGW